MNLDLTRFLIGRRIVEIESDARIDPQRTNQLALVGSLVGSPLIGYFVVREVARRETPPPPVRSDPTGGTPDTPTPIDVVASMARQASETAAAASTTANEAKRTAAQLTTRVEALEKKKQ